MLKIKTSDIAVGSAMPYQGSMLDWENAANASDNNALMSCITNMDVPTKLCLQGTIKTGSNPYDISSGWVIISGQLYPTIAISGLTIGAGQVIVGTITKSYPLVGIYDPVTFSDGTTHDVHENNTIVWSAGSSGTTDLDYDDLIILNEDFHEVGATNEPAFQNSFNSSGFSDPIRFRKRLGQVQITGLFSKTSDGSGLVVFTLPTGYRPTNPVYAPIAIGNSGTYYAGTIAIGTSGNVTVFNASSGTGTHTYTTNFTFDLDF